MIFLQLHRYADHQFSGLRRDRSQRRFIGLSINHREPISAFGMDKQAELGKILNLKTMFYSIGCLIDF